ncbi:hypothetical protein, partial [Novosphingobium sp. Fuku2-ISO-50]|uniref:hypothetical protein n=1 Tax=Novosphingobium sp. Fuku2-ISO-50 TaxID=1739114 RepID=UPI001E440F0D
HCFAAAARRAFPVSRHLMRNWSIPNQQMPISGKNAALQNQAFACLCAMAVPAHAEHLTNPPQGFTQST